MTGIHRILAATDFSAKANLAVRRGAVLAHEHRAVLTLLHVIPRLPLEAVARALVQHPLETESSVLDAARRGLQETAALLVSHYRIEVRYAAAVGSPHEEISVRARSGESDLVVLGAHGAGFNHELLLGSTASRVLRRGVDPVLVVKSALNEPYRCIVAGVDFSSSCEHVVDAALRLAPGAQMLLVHALEPPMRLALELLAGDGDAQRYARFMADEARQRMEAFVARIPGGQRIETLIEQGDAPEVLERAVERFRADLLALGKRGRGEAKAVLIGSVSNRVTYESNCDVLLASAAAAEGRTA